jgi:DNA-binding NtrC family response regulator
MNLVLYASGPVITAQEARELLGGGKPATSGDGFEPWRLTWTGARAAFEREFFKRRLEARDGSLAALAREMGIARTNLHAKLKKLGLEQ